jgi:hypothetical protein
MTFPSSVLFHGTVGPSAEAIALEGLRFRRHEPSFTTDLVTAACTYAVPESHPRASLLAFESQCSAGAVFIVRADRWLTRLSPTSCVWIDPMRPDVCGGITKWIGSYLALYAQSQECRRDELAVRFRAGSLREWSAWKRERGEWLCVPTSDLIGPVPVSAAVLDWLRDIEAAVLGKERGVREPLELLAAVGDAGLSEIRCMAQSARISRWLRRLTLSVLRENGFRILKMDVWPAGIVEDKVLWSPAELRRRMVILRLYIERHPENVMLASAFNQLERLLTLSCVQRDLAESTLSEIERATQL